MKKFVIFAVILVFALIGLSILKESSTKSSYDDDELIAKSQALVNRAFDSQYEPYVDLVYRTLAVELGIDIYDIEINSKDGEIIISYGEPDMFSESVLTDTAGTMLGATARIIEKTDLASVIDDIVLLGDLGGGQMGITASEVNKVIALYNKVISSQDFMKDVGLMREQI